VRDDRGLLGRPSSTFSASSTPEAAISGVMPGYELFCVYPTYLSVLPFWIKLPDVERPSKIETLRPQDKSELRGANLLLSGSCALDEYQY